MKILLPLLIVLSSAVVPAQAQSFISGTVTDESKRPIGAAVVGAGMSSGRTDADGHFSVPAAPGTTMTLMVAAPGFDTLKTEVTVPPDRPLFGLELALRAGPPSTGTDIFSGEAVRAIVQRAAAEWGPRHQNVALFTEIQVRAKWPDGPCQRV